MIRRLFELAVRRPDRAAADADLELAALLEEQVRHLESLGHSPEAARREALRRLGATLPDSVARLRRSAERRERRLRLLEWLDDFQADLRYAARTLRRSPALALAAVLTLALPIGANTAIFSAVNAVLLRPLPVAAPDRLVMLWEENPDFGWHLQEAAPANFLDWKEQVREFADVAAYPSFSGTATLTGQGEPRLLRSQQLTGNLFGVLGVRPVLGRDFREAETWSNTARVVMLTDRTWREVFGADPSIVGRSVQIAGRDFEVIGVLPASFQLPGVEVDIWLPVRWDPAFRGQVFFRRAHWLRVIARLRPEVSLAAADAGLQTVVRRLQQQYPETNTRMGAGLTPLHEFLVGNTRLPLLVVFGAVGMLLLIACANVGNLLLVRAAGREREAVLRLALGAGRGRLVRQALAESALLAGLGGLLGLALGWWGTRVLAALQPAGLLPVSDLRMRWTVLGFVFLATALCAVLFGLAPTLWTGRRAPADVLRDEGRTASGGLVARRWGDALLMSQVGLALALTLGAGLLVRSYLQLLRVEPGFDASNVLAVDLSLPGVRYDSVSKVVRFFDQLEQETRAVPGVQAAAIVSGVPLGPPMWSSQFAIAGRPPLARGSQVTHRELTPEYQNVMRVPLVRGRLLTPADDQRGAPVVLINETLARSYFPGENPVGVSISFDREPDSTSTWRTIVGVVGDERQTALGEPAKPEFIAPFPQEPRNNMTLVVRTRGAPAALAPAVRRIVARLDPLLALGAVRTMEQVRATSLARDRFLTVLMLSFAGVGLLLGLVGVYGVMAQLARRRLREMGIRIALGARAGQVQWLVIRHGLFLTGCGVVVGVAAALAGTRVIRTLLYRVEPGDPLTFVAIPILVLLTALLAAWVPASRASRADPSDVLRAE